MTSTNMCVFVFFVLLSVVHSHVIKPNEFPLPPEGVTLELTVRNNANGGAQPIANMKIIINDMLKKVMVLDGLGDAMPKENTVPPPHKGGDMPRIENRHGILGGTCPIGYVMRGGFCFPDDDY